LSLILDHGKFNVLGFLDDELPQTLLPSEQFSILGSFNDLSNTVHKKDNVAIGFGYPLKTRTAIFEKLSRYSEQKIPTIVHPNAQVDKYVSIGLGAHIHSGTIIRIHSVIGSNVILNSGVIVDHHVEISSNSVVSPGAILCGRAGIGGNAFVGAGAVILPGVKVGDFSFIAAGTIVREDVPSRMMCIGNQGRITQISNAARTILEG
jgi:sugar O-acyltransferase (sialic acid O-acetyltransferase NeuD family)